MRPLSQFVSVSMHTWVSWALPSQDVCPLSQFNGSLTHDDAPWDGGPVLKMHQIVLSHKIPFPDEVNGAIAFERAAKRART